ncbi:glycerol-3-phosphate dehydrogenase [Motilimonas eburnea]|uniref:glycerol-3-phosphate dehydrogenase n=1 Tax=Motilimonas eburnea TaxID=1737488 RepID=UPI001E2EF964|nr:glycerol-3-phosphate dehydrogenase [Motilimonas eburnea]MCE2570869.1 glycerol-3-phosphate dehydrogenase [Motilimonas eburnea]
MVIPATKLSIAPLPEQQTVLDLIVIGAGINGAGIAADAAGQGLTVGLYDAKDIAGATSSASSKLIHGGLRYLEQGDFALVASALAEREIISQVARHLVTPIRFVLPHQPTLRPAWLIRLGLFLYDRLYWHNRFPPSQQIHLSANNPLKDEFNIAFEYSDCWVDDARLVISNGLRVLEHQGEVANYCAVTQITTCDVGWQLTLYDQRQQRTITRQAKAIVNATGPWVNQLLDKAMAQPMPEPIAAKSTNSTKATRLRLVKGSHLVVRKMYPGSQAYILQHSDKRIVFVIPFMSDFTLIGTTDVDYQGDPRHASLDENERTYLLQVVNQHFKQGLDEQDIVWHFSGVRPLFDSGDTSAQNASRDYQIDLKLAANQAPIVTIYGGKITTYRKLALRCMEKLQPFFGQLLSQTKRNWTARAPLPGSEGDLAQLHQTLLAHHPYLPETLLTRYQHQYGQTTLKMLAKVEKLADLGHCFGHDLYQREVDHLIEHEWAFQVDDILWRRTKLGLYLSKGEQQALALYLFRQTGQVS